MGTARKRQGVVIRLLALVLSAGFCIGLTALLYFVWEMRRDGQDYRPLFNFSIIATLTVTVALVAMVLLAVEVFARPAFGWKFYPKLAAFYFLSVVLIVDLITYDFEMMPNHPLGGEKSVYRDLPEFVAMR